MDSAPSDRGFQIIDWEQRRLLKLDSRRIAECMAYYRERRLDGVAIINEFFGFRVDNLDVLDDHPYVEGLYLDPTGVDIAAALRLPRLRLLVLGTVDQDIDCNALPDLEVASFNWWTDLPQGRVILPEQSDCLENLGLHGYRRRLRDFSELRGLRALRSLRVHPSNVTSLSGAEGLVSLEKLLIAYLRSLTDVSALAVGLPRLRNVEISHCPKLRDLSPLSACRSISWLLVNDCKEIESIRFILDLPELEVLRLVGTRVADGDMTPILEHPRLRDVGLDHKRHYSHGKRELMAAAAARAVSAG